MISSFFPLFMENVIILLLCLFVYCRWYSSEKSSCFLFGKQIPKWHPFLKRELFWPIFHISVTGKRHKTLLQHTSHLHIRLICSSYWSFLPLQFCISSNYVWFLFRCDSWSWFEFRPFCMGGRTRLPKFKFSAKFHRFTRDFRTMCKKIQNLLESDA